MDERRWSPNRRRFLQGLAGLGAAVAGAALLSPALRRLLEGSPSASQAPVEHLPVTPDKVPFPKDISFTVNGGKDPLVLRAHYWYNAQQFASGKKFPAIVELNPYRRRDGMMYVDSQMYPWFAWNGYVCFRVDVQGSGDSEGILTDEYTDEELGYCVQVIEQIARLPFCDGNVGMMGKSWSAINSLMVAARDDCPSALKAVVVCAGTDDRYNDDVHYMGGGLMFDNISWPSSMWGWLSAPPDPAVVGQGWEELWRQRIQSADFWFKQWAEHQTRDSYWSDTSVVGRYQNVKVPVHIISGWWDGYKNPVARAVLGLGAAGKEVSGLLGPWGHKYPFDGYPGPRVDWLRYVVTHWWDRWLKGIAPDPATTWPELTAWMGESREPSASRKPDYTESGTWVAEDRDWSKRVKEKSYYLARGRLSSSPPATPEAYASTSNLTLGTSMLETSSWGEESNDDLPGDQTADDTASLYFDSEELTQDLACFGFPYVRLNLECDKPLASIAVRLCEVSPNNKSHLVSYRFFNLCYRDGNMSAPKTIEPGVFSTAVPLNVVGHVFKTGWKLRLSISPSFFPALWQSPDTPTIRIHSGPVGELLPSALVLPGRDARAEDSRVPALLPDKTAYVDPEPYLPSQTVKEGATTRKAEPVVVEGRKGIEVKKVFDSGTVKYGGPLDGLVVTQGGTENWLILENDPLSYRASTHSDNIFERESWKAQSVTDTQVWCERAADGTAVFKYEASLSASLNGVAFETRHVNGTIDRLWV
jgi:uncharacterized protein